MVLVALALTFVPQYAYYMTGIEVTGAKRLSAQQVIALSGLKAPRVIEPKDVEAAKVRLASTGLFTKVGCALRNVRRSVTLVIAVEEPAWQMAVVFDNFVGVTDEQATRAVAADVPTFDGFIPQVPGAAERVQKALERLARASGQPGTVSYMLVADRHLQVDRYRFHLDRASGPLPVCRVDVAGAPEPLRDALTRTTAALVGTDYSRDHVERYAMENLLPIVRRQGYIRARIANVEPARDAQADSGCEGRVRVGITLAPGSQYAWRAAKWSGNGVLTTDQLDALLTMKTGNPADATALDRGLAEVEKAYRARGYLRVTVQAQPSFDETARQVDYAMTVVEGSQYRMGTLDIVGLDESLAVQVKSFWLLAPGQPFDASYPPAFVRDVRARLQQSLAPYKTDILSRPDPASLEVDIVVTFKTS
jgi:outer membrane protein assembly factor BamA